MADSPEDYAHYGCVVLADSDGPRRLVVQPGGTGQGSEDVTALAGEIFDHLRVVVNKATTAWQVCAETLIAKCPPALLEELVRPTGPAGSIAPGKRVEVSWPPEAVPDANALRLTGIVVSVHADGRHVVRYDRGGDWGDTERGVVAERIRRAPPAGGIQPSAVADEPSEAAAVALRTVAAASGSAGDLSEPADTEGAKASEEASLEQLKTEHERWTLGEH